MATFTFHFSFISIIVFKTSGVFREKGKETGLNACCQMANIQPTRSRGEGTEEVKTIMSYRSLLDIKPYSSLKPRYRSIKIAYRTGLLPMHHSNTITFFLWEDLVCRGRTCRAATDLSASPCPPACAYSHPGIMLIDKVLSASSLLWLTA